MVTLKLCSWNVNGIRAAAKKGFLEWLANSDFDVVSVQETKAHRNQLDADLLEHPTHPNTDFNSAERKGYSGVANFFKRGLQPITINKGFDASKISAENLPPKIINVTSDKKETSLNYAGDKTIAPGKLDRALTEEGLMKLKADELTELIEAFNAEGRLLETHLPFGDKEVILFNIYFPNGGQGEERIQFKLEFYEVLFAYIKELQKTNPYIVITGDFNTAHYAIDLARPKTNTNTTGFMPIECVYLDKLEQLGFFDSYRHFNPNKPDMYTWWSFRAGARERNVGWRIDYFYVAEELKTFLKEANIHTETMGSDHCPLSITLAC